MKLSDGWVYHSTDAGFPGGVTREGDDISRIIIDGYNLIGISHRNLGAERDRLIQALSEYRKEKGHDITVVFDGWKSGGRFPESQMRGGIRVIYSRLGDTADSLIKTILGKRESEWIVVTSDRDIAAFAWANGSVPVSSQRFQLLLERGGRTTAGHYDLPGGNETGDEDDGKKRGSPRTPSRKEKALTRVLKKL